MATIPYAGNPSELKGHDIADYLMASNPLVKNVEFLDPYIIVELAGSTPAARTRFFVLYKNNWYVQFHNAGASAVKFSREDAAAWIEMADKPAVNPPAAPVVVGAKKFRVCPECGATSDDANFSTNPPYCDDCA